MHSNFQPPPGTGYLFRIEDKVFPKGPDFKTSVTMPDGRTINVSIWEAVSQKTGKPYLKMRLEEPSSGSRPRQQPVAPVEAKDRLSGPRPTWTGSGVELPDEKDDLPWV